MWHAAAALGISNAWPAWPALVQTRQLRQPRLDLRERPAPPPQFRRRMRIRSNHARQIRNQARGGQACSAPVQNGPLRLLTRLE